jgi:hypothetical protein
MELNNKKFQLDSFYHQIKINCTEFGINRCVIDRYIGQVKDIKLNDKWNLLERGHEDA